MGKTGTSSLQQSLYAASVRLRDKGVLYPQFPHRDVAHHLLVALCGDPNRLPPLFLRDIGGPDAAVTQAEAAWDMICRAVQQRRPDILVLSSEHLILSTEVKEKERLVGYLSRLSDDIVPILYVRHPVHDYRSNLQQRLKTSNRPLQPHRGRIKEAILATEAVFPRPLQLVAFDRQILHGGDIISDFTARFLAPWVDVSDLPARQSNIGLSAEALVLMARLREECDDADGNGFKVALTPQIKKLDSFDPPTQSMTLLPEVADAVMRAAVSHRWLIETGRLHIPDIDISKIDGAALPNWIATAAPQTLFMHDPVRLGRMRLALEKLELKRTASNGSEKQIQKSKGGLIPRIRGSLMQRLKRQLASLQDRTTIATPPTPFKEQTKSLVRLHTPDEPSSTPEKCLARLEVLRPFLPQGSVGAELGVFKGSFIDHLLSTKPRKLYSVDPWYRSSQSWEWAKGDKSTLNAFKRILEVFEDEINTGTLTPLVEFSEVFLASLPDDSLDWAYIDTTHSYNQTKRELDLCCRKVKRSGFILGDDYFPNPSHKHHGVWKAMNEFVGSGQLELVVDGEASQFVARRT